MTPKRSGLLTLTADGRYGRFRVKLAKAYPAASSGVRCRQFEFILKQIKAV